MNNKLLRREQKMRLIDKSPGKDLSFKFIGLNIKAFL
jgi:hypothetical protein